MGDEALEYGHVFVEDMGTLSSGRVRIGSTSIQFKDSKTGKLNSLNTNEVAAINWQRLANKPGLKLRLNDGTKARFGGFKDSDKEKISEFVKRHWDRDLDENELCIKGWNYGDCAVDGQSVEFTQGGKPVFEVPLSNVQNCLANRNEVTLEFHQNEENALSLMEMRFHMPFDAENEDENPVEEFRRQVMQFAGIETEQGQPVASLSQILCATPRGRYDIKVYPNHLSLHGKTYDYKIPIKTIMRLFLVPHKDGRHVFFVLSLNPPIRQGQTRYHYLVLEFLKEEEVELELGLTEEQLKEQYGGKLTKDMSGPIYEIVSKIFRALVNMKISVPGSFVGHSGTPVVVCAHKQASGFLYPLEKGFLYLHKPPMYIRFEEVSGVHFARSDVSTRSFDFEIELTSAQVLLFNSVEKDEYNKLFDYVQAKGLRVRNAKQLDKNYSNDRFAGSDDEIDPYKAKVKAEGQERLEETSDSEDDDYDLDEDLKKRHQLKDSSEGSASEPDEEFDSDADSEDDSGSGESEPDNSEDDGEPKTKQKREKAPSAKKEKKERAPKEGGRKKKAKKDPNAPKRGTSAFMIWLNENRPNIKKPGDGVADVAKRAGELWKSMTADDKKPFEERAATDKARYEKEMVAWKAAGGSSAAASKDAPEKDRKAQKSPKKKSTGPSPSKAKSKEYISDDSDDSDDSDKPLKPKEKKGKKLKTDVKEEVKEEKKDSSEEDESSGGGSDSD